MMFGYASDETEALMPMPIHIAHRLAERLAAVRKDGTLAYLGPDGKTQVSVRYAEGRPVSIDKLLISTQHAEGVDSRGDDQARPLGARGAAGARGRGSRPATTTANCARASSSTRPASS